MWYDITSLLVFVFFQAFLIITVQFVLVVLFSFLLCQFLRYSSTHWIPILFNQFFIIVIYFLGYCVIFLLRFFANLKSFIYFQLFYFIIKIIILFCSLTFTSNFSYFLVLTTNHAQLKLFFQYVFYFIIFVFTFITINTYI